MSLLIFGRFHKNVTLVHNAVSDSHREVILQYSKDNRGATRIVSSAGHFVSRSRCEVASGNSVNTIVMDDLLEVIRFSRAVMKVRMSGCSLFCSKRVPFLRLQWSERFSSTTGFSNSLI